MNGQSTKQGQKIRDGLRQLDAGKAKVGRQDIDAGNKEDALTRHGHECGRDSLASDLLGHIAHNDPTLERKTAALDPQSQRTAFYDLWIVTEQADQLGRKKKYNGCYTAKETERAFNAKPKAFLYPIIEFSAIVKTTEGLETLAEADHSRGTEHHDALHNAHGCDDDIPVRMCCVI